MSDDIYIQLREFMDALPAGFPETPTGVELKLLKKMFTPRQAELTMKLSQEPESVQDICDRTGMDKAELAAELEKMARAGLIFRTWEGEEPKYQAFHFLVGLYEFQLNRLDREFCKLFEEYLPYFHMSMAGQTSQMRVVPVESSLDSTAKIAPYGQAKEIIAAEDTISVSECICRKEQEIIGNTCAKPRETCLMLGKTAQYYIDNGLGRQVTAEEAYRLLDFAEENGLVLSPSNAQKPEMICCCCPCCCPTLRVVKQFPSPGEILSSGHYSVIDGETCTGCGECIEVCPMDAIEDNDGISVVSAGRCIGCGLCVARCPVEAITMGEREAAVQEPLPTMDDVRNQIARQRGL